MTSKNALDTIKNISIGTNAYETVDYEAMEYGYEDCTYIEYEDCGTVEDNYDTEISVIEKDLEILEILLKKEVDIYCITHSMDVEQYNKNCGFSEFSTNLLDEKEFEILQKRALENIK